MYKNSKGPSLNSLYLLFSLLWLTAARNLRNTAQLNASNQSSCTELGWSGPQCLNANYIPIAPGPNAYYNNSVYDPSNPIPNWDGSKLRVKYTDKNGKLIISEYVLASALSMGGLPCWPYYSAWGLWKKIDNGQYKFLSYFSTNTEQLDFGANIQIRLQCATNPWRCALTPFGISRQDLTTNQLITTNPNPTAAMCNYKVPAGKYDQVSVMKYVMLKGKTENDIAQEVVSILENFEMIPMKGFSKPIPVNLAFNKTINFRGLIPGLDPTSVNPDIMRYSGPKGFDNYAAHVPGSDGQTYFVYSFRSCGANKNRPSYERVKLYKLSTDYFPWDAGATFTYCYTLDRNHPPKGNLEDQRTFITDNRVLFVAHGSPSVIPGVKTPASVLIKQFDLHNPQNINVLDKNSLLVWSAYSQLAGQRIPGLTDPLDRNQRPDLDLDNGNLVAVCASFQWPGSVVNVNGVPTYKGAHGASRYFCVNVAPRV